MNPRYEAPAVKHETQGTRKGINLFYQITIISDFFCWMTTVKGFTLRLFPWKWTKNDHGT